MAELTSVIRPMATQVALVPQTVSADALQLAHVIAPGSASLEWVLFWGAAWTALNLGLTVLAMGGVLWGRRR